MSNVDEIKARLDIVDLVSESVQLRKSGKNFTGFCPFHSNTRTPSFVVFPDTGTWRCFGACNDGGDIFKYVMKKEGYDFAEALRRLAERAGVQLRQFSPEQQEQRDELDRLRDLMEEAVTFFRHQLVSTPAGRPALNYISGRGFSEDSLEAWGLGYAPGSWEALLNHFSEKGASPEDLLAAGLVGERDSGGYYDRFRNRIMFPIRDSRGRMAGFGARALSDEDQPKYLNSPQTDLFNKSQLLYGLDRARKSIRSEDEAVIVEGYLDVIGLAQAGYTNAVSPMGTALTEQQLRQLKRLTRRIVLALDADAAGDKATLRGLQVARQTMDHSADPVFDPRGLVRHEARLQADIRVTTLPDGKDPDEIVQEDPDAWPRLLDAARPIVEHVMHSLAADRDLNDPKVKTEIAEQVLPLINDLPNAIERDTYTQKLARLLQVDERSLAGPAPERRRSRPFARPQPPANGDAAPGGLAPHLQDSSFKLEAHCLSILIRHPELIYRVNRALQESNLERMSSEDFEHSDLQEMFRLSLDALEQDILEPASYTLDNLPLPLLDRADELLQTSQQLDPSGERVFEDLLRTIIMLRRRKLHKGNEQMRFLQQAAQEEGDLKASEYQQVMVQNTLSLQRLDKAYGAFSNRNLSKAK
jgi:DNA primase